MPSTAGCGHGNIWRVSQIEPGDTTGQNYGLAVDVGTTTVVAQLIDLKSGNVLGVNERINAGSALPRSESKRF